MAESRGELAGEHVGEQKCWECECGSPVLVKVWVSRKSTVFINRIETEEEWWCPDCIESQQF